jgi:hypothetical protein
MSCNLITGVLAYPQITVEVCQPCYYRDKALDTKVPASLKHIKDNTMLP